MHVAVVGGGVIGLSCAVALLTDGHQVSVFDIDGDRAPSWNNAGHIAAEQVAPLAAPDLLRMLARRHVWAGGALDLPLRHVRAWLPFGFAMLAASRPARFAMGSRSLGTLLWDALPAWQRLAAQLGDPALVQSDGHLIVWSSSGAARRGRAAWEQAETGSATIGDASAADLALLSRLVKHAPGRDQVARFSGTAAIRDLGQLAAALRRRVADLGGTVIAHAAQVGRQGTRARVDGVEADAVLIAAGVASGAVMRRLGYRVPIIAERGYHVRAAATDRWPRDAPPIVFEDRSTIVTRYADTVQAASFVEFASADAPADARKWQRLERTITELGLPADPPFRRWMGARPTLPDYLPAIGRSGRFDNLFYAFGHQHLGLTLAAVTAEAVAALVADRPPTVDLSPFRIERFARRERA